MPYGGNGSRAYPSTMGLPDGFKVKYRMPTAENIGSAVIMDSDMNVVVEDIHGTSTAEIRSNAISALRNYQVNKSKRQVK